jgi:hypothetical protein
MSEVTSCGITVFSSGKDTLWVKRTVQKWTESRRINKLLPKNRTDLFIWSALTVSNKGLLELSSWGTKFYFWQIYSEGEGNGSEVNRNSHINKFWQKNLTDPSIWGAKSVINVRSDVLWDYNFQLLQRYFMRWGNGSKVNRIKSYK